MMGVLEILVSGTVVSKSLIRIIAPDHIWILFWVLDMRNKKAILYVQRSHAKNSERYKSKTPDMEDCKCRVPNMASLPCQSRWQNVFFLKFKINASGTGASLHSYTNSSIMKTQRQSTWGYSKFVFARQTGITWNLAARTPCVTIVTILRLLFFFWGYLLCSGKGCITYIARFISAVEYHKPP